jgi:hypothetical protein
VSPLYDAVIVLEPTFGNPAARVAVFPVSIPVPSTVVPSLNVTVPVGVVPSATPFTIAVRLTVARAGVVVGEMTRLVVDGPVEIVTVVAVLVEDGNTVSPLYTAVTECIPPVKITPVIDVDALASVPAPINVVPS